MSLSTQTLKRLPAIKHGFLKGLNYTQIGVKCGCTERTIDRDVSSWVESGLFETWIREEWVRLHTQIIHEQPVEAYRQVSKILAKMVTSRVESKQTVETKQEVTFNMDGLSEDERTFARDIARRYIKRHDTSRPANIH